jgi:sugar/nucleoside kinase (ribokinase family)
VTRVLVVGDVVDDVVVRPLTGVTHASDTDAEIRRTDGGSAANVAAWLGWLGADVRFVGRAGSDGARRHEASLAAYGVDARISADPDLPTATLVALLDPNAERTMYVDRAANATLTAADLPADVLDGVGWLHLTGYSLFDDGVRPVVLDLVAAARERGCGWSVDPSSVAFLARCPRFPAWVAGADLLLPNEDEAVHLTGDAVPEEAALALGPPEVVVKLGAAGAVCAAGGELHRVAALPTSVVDTTGAGDAFAAGYLAARVTGAGIDDALESGATTAARAVTRLGARP